jgi:hypothetical protein
MSQPSFGCGLTDIEVETWRNRKAAPDILGELNVMNAQDRSCTERETLSPRDV